MKNKNIADSLEHIGDDLLAEAAAKPAAKKRSFIPLVAAAAAVVAITVAAVPIGIWMKNADPNTKIILPPIQSDTNIILPPIRSGMKITGMREKSEGTQISTSEWSASLAANDFPYGIIVEAKVNEILPDVYDQFGYGKYYVVVFDVSDVLLGEDVPKQIFYRYYAKDGKDLFLQCDTYIMSLRQVGIEKYPLINMSKNEIAFFSMMFESRVGDPTYCSTIGFNNGILNESFFDDGVFLLIDDPDNADRYPAHRGDTLEQTRERVKKYISDPPENSVYETKDLSNSYYKFRTASNLFSTDEARKLWERISADGNVFMQDGSRFTRMINGFETEERIRVYTDGSGSVNVEWTGEVFSDDDLTKLPDLGTFIEQLDLNSIVPPHTTLTPDKKRQYCDATGWYTKVNGQVYGGVKIVFFYTNQRGERYYDDIYYLAKTDGTFTRLEASEMKEVIGDDVHLWSSTTYKYNQPFYISY